MSKDAFEYRYEILMKEVDTVQAAIRGYDTILFSIKGWAITIFSAFIFFVGKEDKGSLYLVLASLSVLLFWGLDTGNRITQRVFIRRYVAIEKYLNSPAFTEDMKVREMRFATPDVHLRVTKLDRATISRLVEIALSPRTSYLYLAMLLMLALLALFGEWA